MDAQRGLIWHAFTVAVLLFQVQVVPVWAQSEGAVRGQVLAAANGSALADSLVTLKSASTEEATDARTEADGRFAFANVRPAEYILSISAPGFAVRELRFTVEPREVRTVTISLELSRIDVSIDVAGAVATLPGTHSPSSTTLTLDRLESTPVFQRTTLSDAIVTLAPGMIRGHDDFVHIRGHEVALNPLINGVSFWENTHTMFSSGLSPDVIQTANVMTGGFPAEYGNRFGGVVDIVTRSGLDMENHGGVTASAGGAGRRSGGGEWGGSRGPFGYFMFGSLFESGRYLSPPDRAAIHDTARGAHLFVQFDGSLGNLGSFRTVFMGDGTNFEIPVSVRDTNLRPIATARQDTRQQTSIAGWTKTADKVAVTASFYQRWSRARLFPAAGPLTAKAQLERSLVTVGGKSDVTRFMGRHVVKAGVDAVHLAPRETMSYDGGGYIDFTHLVGLPHIHVIGEAISFTGAESGGQVSAYIQDAIQVAGRVTVDLGVRADRYDLLVSATHASPRANLALQVGRATVLHASYNHFFVPTPIEGVLSSSAGLTRLIDEIRLPLPQLEPTVENQFEAGIATSRGGLQLALTSYFRLTDNPVHTTVWPDSRIYSYASFDRARAHGLEAKADVKSGAPFGVTGYLNYALGRVYFFNPVTGGFVTEAAHISQTNRFLAPMDQTHTLTGGATYRIARTGLSVGGSIEYGSGTPMGHGGPDHDHSATGGAPVDPQAAGRVARVPGHFTAGGSVSFNLMRSGHRRLTVQLDLENVANNVYVIAQEGEFSPAQFSIPRLVSVSAKLRF